MRIDEIYVHQITLLAIEMMDIFLELINYFMMPLGQFLKTMRNGCT